MKDGKGKPSKSAKGKGGGKHPRAEEALQVAALHAIAAAKAFLDVAERVVQDPQLAAHALVAVRTVGKGVLGTLSGFAASPDGTDDDPPIEHIEVG